MELTFYFDRNVGSRFPDALERLRVRVAYHTTKKAKLGITGPAANDPLFQPEEQDDAWLADVGKRGWIVFSHDKKFHKSGYESEVSAIKQFEVGCFYLWGANAPPLEKARCFFRAYDKIVKAIETTERPFIYSVSKAGRLSRIKIK